ncbi:MAG: NAD(P)/FAD-dependent oxidoreductase [Streptosporangiales bacterium]
MRVVVVGAGIVGASAAYHLAVAGTEVVLVDGSHPGQATAAGAGVVFPWQLPGGPPEWQPLAAATVAHWPRLIEALSAPGMPDPGIAQVGTITVSPEGERLEQMYQMLRELPGKPGYEGLGEMELLAAGKPAERFRVLRDDLGGVAVPGPGRVDGRALTSALVEAARNDGATVQTGAASLRTDGTRVTGVDIGDELVEADAVIAAAGAWTPALCAPLGLDVPVAPVRGQLLHMDVPGEDTAAWPVIRAGDAHYLLGFPGGRVVSGSTHEPDAGFDCRITVAGAHHLLTDVLDIAPGLADGTLVEVRVGFRPVSADGLPVLGHAEGVEGLVVATGLGANGLTFGPCMGSVAADLVRGKPTIDLTAYRPDR